MKPSSALSQHRDAIRQIVNRNRACNPRVFGSTAKQRDTSLSDLDLLVDPDPDASLFDLGLIQFELQRLLGVQVDVLTPGDLPDSFRAQVEAEAVPL